jgi:hypothetical protein
LYLTQYWCITTYEACWQLKLVFRQIPLFPVLQSTKNTFTKHLNCLTDINPFFPKWDNSLWILRRWIKTHRYLLCVLLLSYDNRTDWSPIRGNLPRTNINLAIITQLLKKLHAFIESKIVSPCSQELLRKRTSEFILRRHKSVNMSIIIVNTWLRIAGNAKQVHFPRRVHNTDTRACWISIKTFYAFFGVHKLMIFETSLYLHIVPRASFVILSHQHR